jgi:cyclophilin family peptidyl-prolyl cis-trans isomerase
MKASKFAQGFVGVLSSLALAIMPCSAVVTPKASGLTDPDFTFTEGTVLSPSITVGAFDIHRRYRSMEGPYADLTVRMGDLAAAKNVNVPEALVKFVEGNPGGVSMQGGQGHGDTVSSLPDTSAQARKLYWVKGFKLDVLDEKGAVMPDAEFICHFNLDVTPQERNDAFPDGERCSNSRILTITQGQTRITFPEGYGVPVASDEHWRFIFQAANRTTDEHRRIKHRLTVYLIPDKDLVHPITALTWFVPSERVVIDKQTTEVVEKEKSLCPLCMGTTRGVVAPNSVDTSLETDAYGRRVSGHWVVPPGKNTWATVVPDYGFASKNRVIHAAWSHIHPYCSTFSLVKVTPNSRDTIVSATSQTASDPGIQIKNIDYISSKEGIPMPANFPYELVISYDNTSGKALDSMATMGLFFEDNDFSRPKWVFNKDQGQFCGVKASNVAAQSLATNPYAQTPVFDADKDGPLLSAPKTVKVETTAGKLTFLLEPNWAPKTATQMSKLFAMNAFNGTPICNCIPNYLVQVALAEDKAPGCDPVPPAVKDAIRRVPIEVEPQLSNTVSHEAGVLSMAREEADSLGGTTSFSIILANSPHLNSKYTIFGKLTDDPENQKTLDKIKSDWPKQPYIVKTVEEDTPIALK